MPLPDMLYEGSWGITIAVKQLCISNHPFHVASHLRPKITFSGKIDNYLHLMSFVDIETLQVVEIISPGAPSTSMH